MVVIKKVNNEEDVEKLQEDLSKLHAWGQENNMEFNKGKFVVLRCGKNKEIKENTSYFSGDTDEIIEEKESTRDLGITMQKRKSGKSQAGCSDLFTTDEAGS